MNSGTIRQDSFENYSVKINNEELMSYIGYSKKMR